MNTVNGQRSTINVSNIKIKICGNTNLEDALLAAELGADYLGFIFYPKSPRHIKPGQAADIIKRLPQTCQPVGIFVNQPINEIKEIIEKCNLEYVQLHGEEGPDFVAQIPAEIIKAFRLKDENSLNGIENYSVFAYLFDSYHDNLYGGTGQQFDMSLIKDKHFNRLFFISGGLTPENIIDVLKQVNPYAIDVCSGVESSPGKKDPQKLKEFINQISSQLET